MGRETDDVVIAGAGPAGALAALVLARAGARVRLIDRARFPRPKLCGDTINPGARSVLDRLGLAETVAEALPIEGMLVTGGSGAGITGRYGRGAHGLAIERARFDAALVAAAVRAGVRFEHGAVREPVLEAGRVAGVLVDNRGRQAQRLPARVVIAADGAASRLGRALRLAWHPPSPRRWAVGAYFTDVDGMTALGEMHVRIGCYIGVAPLPGGLVNACVVSADRRVIRRAAASLLGVLREDALVGARFAGARPATPPVCLGPLAVESAACGVPGCVLAGDAAGFVDPMTGDGLRFALRGAELAARAVLDELQHGARPAHERLARWRRREFGAKRRFNRALRALVASPAGVRAAAASAAWLHAPLQWAIRYAGDLRTS